MTAVLVTVVLDRYDGAQRPYTKGTMTWVPSMEFPDVADQMLIGRGPVTGTWRAGSIPSVIVVANDTAGPQQEDGTPGWTWDTSCDSKTPGSPAAASYYVLSTNGTTQYLSSLASVPAAQPGQQYVPWPQTPPADGQVFGWDGSQVVAVDQSSGSGTVTSVSGEPANGFTVSVADESTTPEITVGTSVSGLLKGSDGALAEAEAGTDYVAPTGSGADLTGITAAQVGADASGAAATAQTAAETYAAGQASAAQSAAETYAAGVASTAQSNAETYAAGVASTAQGNAETFATSAVGTETTRAEGAEGTLSTAISAETTRAETAEALKVPLTQRGAASGVATLDSGGHVPTTQLPAATTGAQGAVILDGTASDIQPAGIQGAGSTGKVPDAGHVHPAGMWVPADNGFLAANFAPEIGSSTTVPTAGTLYLLKVPIRTAITWTYVWFVVTTQGSGSSTGSYVGLYNSSGTLLTGSSDMGSSLTGNGLKQVALTTPQSLAAGAFVWVAILSNLASTQPSILKSASYGYAVNANLSASLARSVTNGTGLTSLPASITPSGSNTNDNNGYWVAGS